MIEHGIREAARVVRACEGEKCGVTAGELVQRAHACEASWTFYDWSWAVQSVSSPQLYCVPSLYVKVSATCRCPLAVAARVERSGDGCPRGGSRDGREVEREVGGNRSASGRVERDVEACRPGLARGVEDAEVAVRPELPARRDVEADAGAVAREAAVAAGDGPWPEAERSSSWSSSWSRSWWSSRSLSSRTKCRERPVPVPETAYHLAPKAETASPFVWPAAVSRA